MDSRHLKGAGSLIAPLSPPISPPPLSPLARPMAVASAHGVRGACTTQPREPSLAAPSLLRASSHMRPGLCGPLLLRGSAHRAPKP